MSPRSPILFGLTVVALIAAAEAAPAAPASRARRAPKPVDTGSFEITESGFKDLFNKYRLGQPKLTPWAGDYFPFADHGIAVKDDDGSSPTLKFDRYFKLKNRATDYENESHSCDGFEGSVKEDCEGWYGHCNGWAGAGIKEEEPRQSIQAKGIDFGVADQKALLSEMWLDATTLIAGWSPKGEPTGDWVYKPDSPKAKKIIEGEITNYDAFWDPSPRAFFLIFTNYIGIDKVGLIIDRFTGAAVWNQPVAGYRFEKLTADDLGSVERDGKTIYFAKLTARIYWPSDEVEADHLSSKFDIAQPDKHGDDYVERVLKFKLFFDAPVTLDDQGDVASAGRLVGPGIWAHQEDPSSVEDIDQTHPDFIWLPTDFAVRSQYGNPYVRSKRVYQVLKSGDGGGGEPEGDSAQSPEPATYTLKIKLGSFPDGDHEPRYYVDKLSRRLRDSDIVARFATSGLQVVGNHIEVDATFAGGETLEQVYAALAEGGYEKWGR